MSILAWLNPLKIITAELGEAYQAKLDAKNSTERIGAEIDISNLKARRDVLLAEQGHWTTRWIRPALAAPAVIFWWKIVVWDTVLGLGTTPDPGEYVMWFALTVPNVYFLMRPFERFRSGRRDR